MYLIPLFPTSLIFILGTIIFIILALYDLLKYNVYDNFLDALLVAIYLSISWPIHLSALIAIILCWDIHNPTP